MQVEVDSKLPTGVNMSGCLSKVNPREDLLFHLRLH